MKKYRKKILCLVLVFVLVCSNFVGVSAGDTQEVQQTVYTENGLQYVVGEEGTTVVGYEGEPVQIVIPETLAGKSVVAIGEEAFYQCDSLEKVKLPASIRTLGISSFEGCEQLTEINLPEGLERVEQNALSQTGIEEIHLPASCTFFNEWMNMTNLKMITVEEGNVKYKASEGVLYQKESKGNTWKLIIYPDKKSEEEFKVPEDVSYIACSLILNQYLKTIDIGNAKIGNANWINCNIIVGKDNPWYTQKDGIIYNEDMTQLIRVPAPMKGKIVIENGVKQIINGACKQGEFSEIEIPDTVEEIQGAFFGCKNLKFIKIPNSVKKLTENTFRESGIEEVVLSNQLQRLELNTFLFCRNLKKISIPKSMSEISTQAFSGCTNLEEIVFEGAIPKIDDSAFGEVCAKVYYEQNYNLDAEDKLKNYSGSLTWYPYDANTGVIHSGKLGNALTWKVTNTGILEISGKGTMPNFIDLDEVPWDICYKKIESIIIREGVHNIGDRVFYRCVNAKELMIYNEKCDIGDISYFDNSGLLICGYEGSSAQTAAKTYGYDFKAFEKKTQKITASSVTKTYGSKSFYLGAKTSGNGKLSYSSSNKKTATISSSGKITIKGYGSTTITIRAASTGTYKSAVKKIMIKIVPRKGSLKSVTSPSKRKMKLSWSKNSTVSGYQVYISKKKDFSKYIKKKTYGRKTTSVTMTGWTSKNRYYIKIRSYKKVGKTNYYGAWSNVKSVKIK